MAPAPLFVFLMNFTQLTNTISGASSGCFPLLKSGPGTICRLAGELTSAGRHVAILAGNRGEFNAIRALLALFTPDMSLADQVFERPRWDFPWVSLPQNNLEPADASGRAKCAAALYSLQKSRTNCLVTMPENLLLRFMPGNFFDVHELEAAVGHELSPEMVIEQVVEWGYERVQVVVRPGEVARRGDILDIFPSGYEKPARLEFFGDIVEDIRLFDPASQRSVASLKKLVILPASPLDSSEKGRRKARERFERLFQKKMLAENELYDLKRALEGAGAGITPGVFYDAPTVLEEWLPRNVVWIIPEYSALRDNLESSWRILKEKLESGGAGPCQPARLALRDPAGALAALASGVVVSAEPLVMGVKPEGTELPEHSLHSFKELFPSSADSDRPWQTLVGGLKKWREERRQVILVFNSDKGRHKFLKLAEQDGLLPALRHSPEQRGLFALVAPYRQGLDRAWDNTLVLGEDIIMPRAERTARVASGAFKGLNRHDDLNAGDLLVHRDYGIGRFAGLNRLDIGGVANDFLLIEYSGADKLYVPADRLGLIQRFKGDGEDPTLDRLGGTSWLTGKEKTRKAIEKIAADLVEIYAYRKVTKGFKYGPPGEIYREFEASFGFDETPDQAKAIQDVFDDMDRPEPMDRLVCGDVGFGKTEVAMRAAFRAAAEGRQVALLCPTTILAEQHYQTFRARLANFPINVGLLSRFVSKAKQQEVLKAAGSAQIDILIGTHRILSDDVKLPNIGLLILDEEQRFGVRHKDKLKAFKKNVDVLTLTATPIPRTLQLSMSGIRDLSIIETAPPERKPVATAILRRDPKALKEIVERELAREGQVFWVHNRVKGLEQVAAYVSQLVPSARIGMAHGQMAEGALEDTMRRFWHGDLDILVCTAIVESGLDFPRANTLIVDQAQMFGLGQLYQLRGRVGRSDRQAYAIFVAPEEERLSDISRERLRIILELDYLGAGFQVAMEDLRLRGAGNILGEVQSGHMTRVGLDLFLEMLEQAVARLKGSPLPSSGETELNLALPANIPETYIQEGRERLRYYKALTSAEGGRGREEAALEMRDRFGSPPPELENFLAVLDLKEYLGSLHVQKADIYPDRVRLAWAEDQSVIRPEALVELVRSVAGTRLAPPAILEMPLDGGVGIPSRLRKIREALEPLRPATREHN